MAHSIATRRPKRARAQTNYAVLAHGEFVEGVDDSEEELETPSPVTREVAVDYRKLSKLILEEAFSKQSISSESKVLVIEASDLAQTVKTSGFRCPLLVRGEGGDHADELGMRLPQEQLSVDALVGHLGKKHNVQTIDVSTQSDGPEYSMSQWARYWKQPPSLRKTLLSVQALSVAGTALEKMVEPPALVQQMDMVGRVWPEHEREQPEAQVHLELSPAGCYQDFYILAGGSSSWVHMLDGQQVFLFGPPSTENWEEYAEWFEEGRSRGEFLAKKGSGWSKAELKAGDSMLIPGGWLQAVVTLKDSIVLGGQFLSPQKLGLQLQVWQLEDQLRLRPAQRFPYFKQIMWFAARFYLERLQELEDGLESRHLSRAEKKALPALAAQLRQWLRLSRGDRGDLPQSIVNPEAMLRELEELMSLVVPEESSSGLRVKDGQLKVRLRPASPERAPQRRKRDEFVVPDSPVGSKSKAKPSKAPLSKSAAPVLKKQPSKSTGVRGRLMKKIGVKHVTPIFSKANEKVQKQEMITSPTKGGGLGLKKTFSQRKVMLLDESTLKELQKKTIEPEKVASDHGDLKGQGNATAEVETGWHEGQESPEGVQEGGPTWGGSQGVPSPTPQDEHPQEGGAVEVPHYGGEGEDGELYNPSFVPTYF